MIHIKTEKELEKMRVAGRLTAIARKAAADAVKPGVTTWEIDRIVRKTIEDAGAKPSFLGYGGFPGSACVSLNDQVIHGILPSMQLSRKAISLRLMLVHTSAVSTATAPARFRAVK